MKPLAEIRPRPGESGRPGALRRGDLEVLGAILDALGEGVALVTGAGDGRLALSTGLASAAAAAGLRAALVDCDLEEPTLDLALDLDPEPGLHEYLRAEARAPEILQPLVLAGPASEKAIDSLVCISAGAPAPEGRVPIDAPDFRHAIAKLRSGYDLVVLHGPPLGDESGALRAVVAEADRVLVCAGPELASGRSGRRLKKALRGLAGRAAPADLVVYRS